jgi:transcriptional regulator
MYVPKAFAVTDREVLHSFVEANSFATLVTTVAGAPFATRLPLILDRTTGAHGTLIGHVARANPHWRSFDGKTMALAMFDGPHAYISPHWYATSPAVPTWNYATVHAYGTPRVIDDPSRVEEIVDRLTATYEAALPQPWSAREIPAEFKASLLKAIVGFEMPIDRIEGKFKFGQNRPIEDQVAMLAQLEAGGDAGSHQLADLIRHEMSRSSH